MRISVSKNFYLDEFVDPFTYFNEDDNGLSKIDPKVIVLVQLLRDLKGSGLAINNWWGYYIANKEKLPLSDIITNIEKSKLSKWSGYRSSRCSIGSLASAHKMGKAADPKGNENDLIELVLDNAKTFYELGLRRLEDPKITKGWLHIDTNERNCIPNHINVVDLKIVTQRIKI